MINGILLFLILFVSFLLGYKMADFIKVSIKEMDFINFILELVKEYVDRHPNLMLDKEDIFFRKIKKWLKNEIKLNLTDEQWAFINEKLIELYGKLKSPENAGEFYG